MVRERRQIPHISGVGGTKKYSGFLLPSSYPETAAHKPPCAFLHSILVQSQIQATCKPERSQSTRVLQVCGLKPFLFHLCCPQASSRDTVSSLGPIVILEETWLKIQTHPQVSLLFPVLGSGSSSPASLHAFLPLRKSKYVFF